MYSVKLTKRGLLLAKKLGFEVDKQNCMASKNLFALRQAAASELEGRYLDSGGENPDTQVDFETDPEDDDAASLRSNALCTRFYYTGGSESHLFNRLEDMIYMRRPTTPALGVVAPKTIQRENVGRQVRHSAPSMLCWSGFSF